MAGLPEEALARGRLELEPVPEDGVADVDMVDRRSRDNSVAGGGDSIPKPGTPTTLERTHSSGWPVLIRTHSGFQASVGSPEQLCELQCGVCGNLIQGAIHAPCGHSFCHTHLQAGEGAWSELEQQAAQLHELSVVQGFPWRHVKEALAKAGDGGTEKARELLVGSIGLEGRAVRVRPDVKEPHYQWGAATHESVGVVMQDEGGESFVHFPEVNGWHCLSTEIEVEPVADAVRAGVAVKLRTRAGKPPRRGAGEMSGDAVGRVVSRDGCHVSVLAPHGLWLGFVDELYPVPSGGEESPQAALQVALENLKAGGYSPPLIAHIAAALRQVLDLKPGEPLRAVIQDTQHKAVMQMQGAVDVLRAAGLEGRRWSPTRTIMVFEPAGEPEAVPELAARALEALEAAFGPLPDLAPADPSLYRTMLTIDPEFLEAGIPVTELWTLSLRSMVVPAIAPPSEVWSWQQRGWAGEDQLLQSLEATLPHGQGPVVRRQTKAEAERVAQRLRDSGLLAEVEEELSAADEATISRPKEWLGDIPKGARVRIKAQPGETALVGVVVGQVQVASREPDAATAEPRLHYMVQVPKQSHLVPQPASALERCPEADAIVPGAKVRVRPGPGREPTFGWGRIQGSDVGVVHQVLIDGTVEVFFPTEEKLWKASLQDLDTTGLPEPVRTDCPVCHRAFPRGQKLAVDIAVDAQIRRMQGLVAHKRGAGNNSSGGGGRADRQVLLRSKSHVEEVQCNICFDLLTAPVTLPCGHSYCKHHIEIWLTDNDVCPVCRVRVRVHQANEKPERRVPLRSVAILDIAKEPADSLLEGGHQGPAKHMELHVNAMLEKQVARFFPNEIQVRGGEVASELWDMLQKGQQGSLARVRSFLEQFRAEGVARILALSNQGPDMVLPGTVDGTLLMLACEQGLTDVVQELLGRGADPTRRSTASFGFFSTPLQAAAAAGSADVVRVLLGAVAYESESYAGALGAAIETSQQATVELLLDCEGAADLRNFVGFTALMTAVQAGHAGVIAMIAARKADLEARTTKSLIVALGAGHFTANGAYLAAGEFQGRPLYGNAKGAVICCNSWWKVADSLQTLEKGESHQYSMPSPHHNGPEPPVGRWTIHGRRIPSAPSLGLLPPFVERLVESRFPATPLLLSARLGDVAVAQSLLDARADLDARLASGRSVLHVAAQVGSEPLIVALLGRAADVNQRDHDGFTPLHLACHAGFEPVARALLAGGAHAEGALDAPAADAGGGAPSPLLLAASCGLLAGCEVDPKVPGTSEAYLHIVQALLEARASAAGSPGAGLPLLGAARAGGAPIVDLLLQHQADPSAAATATSPPPLVAALLDAAVPRPGATPGPHATAARALLKAGAAGSARCEEDGVTALMLAAALGDEELVKELIGHGADVAAARRPATASGRGPCVVASTADDGPPWEHLDVLLQDHGARMALPGLPLCPRGHSLERLTAKRCTRKPVCDVCRTSDLQARGAFWTCWDCDHDLCFPCTKMAPMVSLPPGVDLGLDNGEGGEGSASASTKLPDSIREAFAAGVLKTTMLEGWQALHFAAASGKREALVELAKAGAATSAQDADGMTALHWAALLGKSECVEVLLEHGADAAQRDSRGRLPVELLAIESLRYAYSAAEGGSEEVRGHMMLVTGAGDVDGAYVMEAPKPKPAAEGRENANMPEEDEEEPRPTYRRGDGDPFIVQWDKDAGWTLGTCVGPKMTLFQSSDKSARRCPLTGWSVAQELNGGDAPVLKIVEALPWRAGSALLAATPADLRPNPLREEVEALPPWQPPSANAQVGASVTFGPQGMTIQVPAGLGLPMGMGLPMGLPLLQAMAEGAAHAGGGGPPGAAAGQCPVQ